MAQYCNNPAGCYYEVTCDTFFSKVGPMNVHPRSEREASYWERPNRELIGKTTPGYLCEGPKAYFLVRSEAE